VYFLPEIVLSLEWFMGSAQRAEHAGTKYQFIRLNDVPGLMVIFSPAGEVVSANDQTLQYVGQSIEEFRDWSENNVAHPDDMPAALAIFTSSLASGRPYEMETRLRRFDGVYRWFQIRGWPVRDGDENITQWHGLMIDVHDRKRAEEELHRSQAFLADGERFSQTGTYTWVVDSSEATFSDETCRIFGFEPGAHVTVEMIRDRTHPDYIATLHGVMEEARIEGRHFVYESRLRMPDMTVKYIRVASSTERNQSGELELRGVVQDVSASFLADQAMSKLRSELAHITRVSSLSALTASIAHEVNQPLSGIVTNANTCLRLLTTDPPNLEIATEAARRIVRDSNRAGDVVGRLRSLYSKQHQVEFEPVDLADALREVLPLVDKEFQRLGISVRTIVSEAASTTNGDRIQLQQVILNLLRNAADAMSGVNDRQKRITVRIEEESAAAIRLSVSDVGTGFSPGEAERLFEAFFTTKQTGMGIGLFVSRSIIEGHSGKLWAENNDGPGATLNIVLPKRLQGEKS
jgi:PAS domain S-box-containing protein